MRIERKFLGSVWALSVILLIFLVETKTHTRLNQKKTRGVSKRKLEDDKSNESKENGSDKSGDEEEEEIEEDYVKNIYETKMIEFEDEIEGQTYLGAIGWEDRYWLDFYNLMNTVKGKLFIE